MSFVFLVHLIDPRSIKIQLNAGVAQLVEQETLNLSWIVMNKTITHYEYIDQISNKRYHTRHVKCEYPDSRRLAQRR